MIIIDSAKKDFYLPVILNEDAEIVLSCGNCWENYLETFRNGEPSLWL
jgi:hypothetical protein